MFWRLQPVFAAICYATVYDWGSLGSVPTAPSGDTSAGLAQFVTFLAAALTAPQAAA